MPHVSKDDEGENTENIEPVTKQDATLISAKILPTPTTSTAPQVIDLAVTSPQARREEGEQLRHEISMVSTLLETISVYPLPRCL